MIVYLDVLLIENFIVNLFLMYITAQTVRMKPRISSLVLAALLGAMYAIGAVLSNFQYFFMVPLKFIVAIIMIFIVFRKNKMLFIIKSSILFILFSMMLAGLCIFIELDNSISSILIFDRFSYKILLSAIMIIYIIIHRIITYISDRNELDNLIFDIEIVTENSSRKVRAFFDTGNELREPATNLPVIIVEKGVLLEEEVSEKNKFIIPYRVVNGDGGKLEGFKPKYIKIHNKEKVLERQVIIAICDNNLSSMNDYNALLSRGIL